MNGTNLNIVLTNALCCISAQAVKVSKLYSIGDKCADSELQKLKLMNDWFEALRCYKADPINSKFMLSFSYNNGNELFNQVSESNVVYSIIINGITYSVEGDDETVVSVLIRDLLLSIEEVVSHNLITEPIRFSPRGMQLLIEADCDIETIKFTEVKDEITIELDVDMTMYQQGLCTPINCLTEDQFETIVAKLMKECDICECQLTQ